MPGRRPISFFADRDSAPWWEALARHELLIQRCDGCDRWRWPPRATCNSCGSFQWSWHEPSGRGHVASWTVTHRAASDIAVPYVVVLVRIEEQDDIFLPGHFDGPQTGVGLTVGLEVFASFEDVETADGTPVTLLCWNRATNGAGRRA
jgi:uncharacterized protein